MTSAAALVREGMVLLTTVGGPLFAVLFGAGLIIGVLQAATQVNDPAVGFLPRIVAAVLVCLTLGGWMVDRLAGFLRAALERMALEG